MSTRSSGPAVSCRARCEAAVAAFESAEEKLAAATAALEQATGKLQQTRDAVMAGDDPEAEPTLAALEYLKIAEAVLAGTSRAWPGAKRNTRMRRRVSVRKRSQR